jgi:hypothetical protein
VEEIRWVYYQNSRLEDPRLRGLYKDQMVEIRWFHYNNGVWDTSSLGASIVRFHTMKYNISAHTLAVEWFLFNLRKKKSVHTFTGENVCLN